MQAKSCRHPNWSSSRASGPVIGALGDLPDRMEGLVKQVGIGDTVRLKSLGRDAKVLRYFDDDGVEPRKSLKAIGWIE